MRLIRGIRSRYLVLFTVLMLLFATTAGCGVSKDSSTVQNTAVSEAKNGGAFGGFGTSNSHTDSQVKTEYSLNSNYTAAKMPAVVTPAEKPSSADVKQGGFLSRKIVLSGTMDIESNKFDRAIDGITKLVVNSGGYAESSNISGNKSEEGNFLENRSANFVLRVPYDKFQYIMSSMGSFGTIINKTTNGEDVTYQYYDNETRLKTLKVKEERILDILKRTKDMQDVLSAENELQNTLYDIENLTSTQKKLQSMIDYSTITINVKEVYQDKKLVKKPQTLGERISFSFKASMRLLIDIVKGIIVALVALLPFAVIVLIILGITWYIVKKRKKPESK